MKNLFVIILLLISAVGAAYAKDDVKAQPEIVKLEKIKMEEEVKPQKFQLINNSQKVLSDISYYFENDSLQLLSLDGLNGIYTIEQKKELYLILKKNRYLLENYKVNLVIKFKKGDDEDYDSLIVPIWVQFDIPNIGQFKSHLIIPDLHAKIGEAVKVPIVLKVKDFPIPVNSFSCNLVFNASVLTPSNANERGRIVNGNHIISITRAVNGQDLNSGDVLASIDMIAMLGDAPNTLIRIEDFRWNLNGYFQNFPIIRDNGLFQIDDIYYDNQIPRLINKVQNEIELNVLPNPITDNSKLELIYHGNASLIITNSLGEVVKELSKANLPVHNSKTSIEIAMPKSEFAGKGIYYARLSSNTNTISRILIIE